MVNINNLRVNKPFFIKGTTTENVFLVAKLSGLMQDEIYDIDWLYQFSGQTEWTKLNSDKIIIKSFSTQNIYKNVQFTPYIPTDTGSVRFKTIISRANYIDDPIEILSGAIPINNTNTTSSSESLKTPIITNLVSTNSTGLKLDKPYRPELLANVSNLTPGVNYSCDWSYMLDELNTAERDLGTSIITSNTDKVTKISNSEIKIPSYVNSDTSYRKIYFILRISATDPSNFYNSVSTYAFTSGFYCVNSK
jgi:hypothetical protein